MNASSAVPVRHTLALSSAWNPIAAPAGSDSRPAIPSGNWTEFFVADITVDDTAPLGVPPAALDSRLPELIPELLRLRVQRATAPWAALADEVISAALAEPLNALPVPPFHGALEGPKGTGLLGYGRLAVHGWLAHRTAKITCITALVDAVQEAVLLHGPATHRRRHPVRRPARPRPVPSSPVMWTCPPTKVRPPCSRSLPSWTMVKNTWSSHSVSFPGSSPARKSRCRLSRA
jgi:hypothetical protein